MTWDEAVLPVHHDGDFSVAVLFIHGFTSTPGSIKDWAEGIHKGLGASMEVPLLPGHGTTWDKLNTIHWQDWESACLAAFDRLAASGKPVVVGGLSLGGLLACLVALRRPVAGLILVNNLMWLDNPALFLAPIIKRLKASIPAIAGDIANPEIKEPAYSQVATGGIDQFRRLMKFVRGRLGEITSPLLLFKSRQDHVIPLSSARRTYHKIGSTQKELVWLERSYHVATLDYDLGLIIEKSTRFLQSVASLEKGNSH